MNVTFPFKTRRPAARNDSTEIADRIAWVEEWSKTDTNCLKNCVFFFRWNGFWYQHETSRRTIYEGHISYCNYFQHQSNITVVGAISARYVEPMELRNPQEYSSKWIRIDFANRKTKASSKSKKNGPKGTVTGHYLHFIQKTMDEVDYVPEMKKILYGNRQRTHPYYRCNRRYDCRKRV